VHVHTNALHAVPHFSQVKLR